MDPTKPTRLRPEPLESLRFLVDENVARLALFLRLLGYDAAHDSGWTDDHIARLARTQGRVVLTRDRQLLKRSPIVHGRLVRSQDPRAQIEETARFFGLTRPASPSFDRCLRCNRLLESVDKAVIEDRLLPKTRKYYHEFRRCPGCDRIYWQGSHPEKMAALVESLDIPTRQPVALEKGHKTL